MRTPTSAIALIALGFAASAFVHATDDAPPIESQSVPSSSPSSQHTVQLVSDGGWSMDTTAEEGPVCIGDTVVVRPPLAAAQPMLWYETAAPTSCAPKQGGYVWRPNAGHWNPKLAGEHWFVASTK